jgi:hypothetical protein
VATDFSATSPAVAADTPPTAALTALACHAQACTLSLTASDPNALALTVTAAVSYEVAVRCHAKRGHRRRGRQPTCHATHTAALPVGSPAAGAYSASAAGLPFGERLTFTATVTNAAGLHPSAPLTRFTTLHRPKKQHKQPR